MTQEEGRGALIGEFLESFFSSTAEVQDRIIYFAVKNCFCIEQDRLIDPYPVLRHLSELIKKSKKTSAFESK